MLQLGVARDHPHASCFLCCFLGDLVAGPALRQCVLLTAGRSGQLGHGDLNKRLVPRVVKPLLHTAGRRVAIGAEFTMAITSWKPPAPMPPPSPSPVPQFEGLGTSISRPSRPIARSISSVAFSGRDTVWVCCGIASRHPCKLHLRLLLADGLFELGVSELGGDCSLALGHDLELSNMFREILTAIAQNPYAMHKLLVLCASCHPSQPLRWCSIARMCFVDGGPGSAVAHRPPH